MADFSPNKIDLSKINDGKRYNDGDIPNAEGINAAIEASAYAQGESEQAKQAASGASESATSAQNAATSAAGSAAQAVAESATAQAAASEAQSSASASATAASQAAASASTAQAQATSAAESAQTAANLASSAQTAAETANSNATAAVNTANSAASTANLAKAASDTATAKVAELSEQIGEKQGTTVTIGGVAQGRIELESAMVGNATNATNVIPVTNGIVNPNGRKDGFEAGDYSVAFGSGVVASGGSSTAIGPNASASSLSATAIGSRAIASGGSSTAIGQSTYASGEVSTALGYGVTASGVFSTALGFGANTAENDTNTMQLGGDGLSVLRSKVNLTVTSDERDKTDISDITNALAFLEKLNPVTFVSNDRANYISESDKESENYRKYGMCEYDRIAHAAGTKKGERRRCGLLAQEVVAAMQTVYGTDNYANIVNDNFHDLQEKPSDVENKYTLAYANLVPFLIGAIKELNARIKELESK